VLKSESQLERVTIIEVISIDLNLKTKQLS